jgi:orotidine-5'-phosphate decarboxylase
MNPHNIDNPLILALDFSDIRKAEEVVSKARPHIGMVKIGTELFSAYGREALSIGSNFNIPVFLDLKLHDIPTTVKKTVEVLCDSLASVPGQHFLSVHSLGGLEMVKQAVEATKNSNVTIAAVTLLTSLESQDLTQFRNRQAGALTVNAIDSVKGRSQYDYNTRQWTVTPSGIKIVIAAPTQLDLIKKRFKDEFIIITPGIRSDEGEANDHKRSKPMSFAIKHGSDWVVVGRPITQSSDPEFMAAKLHDQIMRARG